MGFVVFPDNDIDIVYYPVEKPSMETITNVIQTYKGHSYPKIEQLEILGTFKGKEKLEYKEEDREHITNVRVGEI